MNENQGIDTVEGYQVVVDPMDLIGECEACS